MRSQAMQSVHGLTFSARSSMTVRVPSLTIPLPGSTVPSGSNQFLGGYMDKQPWKPSCLLCHDSIWHVAPLGHVLRLRATIQTHNGDYE